MRKAPLLRFTLASMALACSQAFAAPSPYSTLIVFGDSLSDAGQFPDLTGGTAGMRFTNRDADGNYAPVSPMILGGRLGISPDELNPSTSVGIQPDGNNWAVGGYTTQQILDSITTTSETVIPPGNPGAGLVLGTFLAARVSKPALPEPRVERAGSVLPPESSRSDRP